MATDFILLNAVSRTPWSHSTFTTDFIFPSIIYIVIFNGKARSILSPCRKINSWYLKEVMVRMHTSLRLQFAVLHGSR
jgi:hypothetical protein